MTIALLVLPSLASLRPVYADVDLDNFPRLDNLFLKISYPEATAMVAARAGELDNMVGMIDADNVDELSLNMSWSISASPGFHMCYMGINCRDNPPVLGGGEPYMPGAPYGNRTPSFELYPLNESDFRFALNVLIGCRKTAWISTLYRFINVRLDTNVPPANVYYFNTAVPPVVTNETLAYEVLTDPSGLNMTNSTGNWIMPDGSELRPLYVISPAEAPPSVALAGLVTQAWNDFFGSASAAGPYHGTGEYFYNYAESFYGEVEWVFMNRDFDIYMLCWGLSKDPDYLYWFFHPDTDFYDGWNSPGLRTPDNSLEDKLYACAYWEWPNGTAVIGREAMRDIVFDIQWDLYFLVPYIPLYSRAYHNAYAPGVYGWIESLGYGSNNFFTKNFIHWTDLTEVNMTYHETGPVNTLNPAITSSAYEADVLSVVLDGGILTNPFTHETENWMLSAWNYDRFNGTTPTGDYCDGTELNMTLRPGITWHDGYPFTTEDIVWNYEYAANTTSARQLYFIGTTYVNSTVASDYQMTVWFNATGLFNVETYVGSIALLAPQIYHGMDNTTLLAFQPWTTDYVTHTGDPNYPTNTTYPGLTCLIGTGPYVFVEFDDPSQVIWLTAYRGSGYWAPFLREDTNIDGVVDITDIVDGIADFGSQPGHPRWSYGKSDVNADYVCDISDIVSIISKFGSVTLP
jgi:ABC-type transport system substrate-binding protein